MYVYDLSTGAVDPKGAIELYKAAKSIFAEANMNLRIWRSNNRDVNEFIEGKHVNIEESSQDTSYAISFRIPKSTEDVVTKKKLLKRIASIFDPVGILSPAVLPLKILFQRMCKEGGSWDDDINNEFKAVWKKWLLSAHKTSNVVIPRYYLQKEKPVEFEIIGYCDASEKAYSAVTYLRVTYKNGQVSTQIIVAKTRVSLAEVITIPQLELMSRLLLARLVHSVYFALTRRFPISKVLCLNDSGITLARIQNEKKQYKQFVHNRVREVRELNKTDMWQHLPGKENNADLSSGGCLPEELSSKIGLMVQVGCHRKFQLGPYPKISKDLQIKKRRNSSTKECKHQFQQS